MSQKITYGGLQVDAQLDRLIKDEILPGTDIDAEHLWGGFEDILNTLGPVNRALLDTRASLQRQIDDWHRANPDYCSDLSAYKAFLSEIGYLVDQGEDFSIDTANVDPEIATVCGSQLVVPINNARFALNAANARWGSLYDAYYGSDVISLLGDLAPGQSYNPLRGEEVIRLGAEFLDQAVPLADASHADVSAYQQRDGQLVAQLISGGETALSDAEQFIGYRDEPLSCVLLRNNHLHIELLIDREHAIGKSNPSGVKDIVLEAALSTILDCEDSVAAVDAEDKVLVYRNCLGLMQGKLSVSFKKNGELTSRGLKPDRHYTSKDGQSLSLKGRALLLIRNVGHLMTTDAVLDQNGDEVPEGFLDALITNLCALHDVRGNSDHKNSTEGSIYIVKPKMHGPDEVRLTHDLFSAVEDLLQLPRHTIKVGIMDEERRTSANLKACIAAAKSRLFFINTGFLDRTGDEIHTHMYAGAVMQKEAIKSQPWLKAYEDGNVDIGIACGLPGRAQIGKGMWAKPDELGEMVRVKIEHPLAGASCAWVPAPIGAVLHATHYHSVNVPQVQADLSRRKSASLDDLLTPPLQTEVLPQALIHKEIENNAQSILGYVVRWIDQGIGCSKVPDISNVGLMEDRATLRISSQLLANWLCNGLCTEAQITQTLEQMAVVVDAQNKHDPNYTPMAPGFDGLAFKAAKDLILKGAEQPSGYTEPLLHALRRARKAEILSGEH